MNKSIASAAAIVASLTVASAFAQSAPSQINNEISAGAAAPMVDSSLSRDQVTRGLQQPQQTPDSMANETGAGAAVAPSTSSTTTRQKIRDAMQRAQHASHSQMDTERAAWG